MSSRPKEVLPPPIQAKDKAKAKLEKNAAKPKHKIVVGEAVLGYKEGSNYVRYGNKTKPSKKVLLKRVREWEKSKSAKKKRCSFKVGAADYELTYQPTSKKLFQTNLATNFSRRVKVLTGVRVSPPLPFYGQTHFPRIPLPDLCKALSEAVVGGPVPRLLASCFSDSAHFSKVVKDVIEVSELDRLKQDYSIGLHGTSDHAAQRIIRNGFDMSRFGQRASYHGNGVYVTACLPTARSYGKNLLIVAFHTNPKPHIIRHGGKGLDTAVVHHAKNVLPLMWIR